MLDIIAMMMTLVLKPRGITYKIYNPYFSIQYLDVTLIITCASMGFNINATYQ